MRTEVRRGPGGPEEKFKVGSTTVSPPPGSPPCPPPQAAFTSLLGLSCVPQKYLSPPLTTTPQAGTCLSTPFFGPARSWTAAALPAHLQLWRVHCCPEEMPLRINHYNWSQKKVFAQPIGASGPPAPSSCSGLPRAVCRVENTASVPLLGTQSA